MSIRLLCIPCSSTVLAAAFLMVSAPASGALQVQFLEPERYTDARLDNYYGTDEHVLRIVEQHLQGLASRCLSASEALHIQVLDIDLAGQQEWWNRSGTYNLRIMRETTWPRIKLVYTLRRGNGEFTEARERLSDMNYLWNSAYVRADSMPLPYERVMLTSWFERAFCR
jgi:hypothetical protein